MSSQSQTVGKGETFTWNLVYKDADGNPKDLTSHTLAFKILVPNLPGADPVYSLTPTKDSSGNIGITISAATTATFDEGEYIYLLTDTVGSTVDWLLRDRLFVVDASSLDTTP